MNRPLLPGSSLRASRSGRVVLVLSLVVFSAGCADPAGDPRSYRNNDLQGVATYTARSVCSCLFVSGMPDGYCRANAKESPDVALYLVDPEAKTVEATALLSWSGRAHYVDEQRGCVAE